MFAKSIVLSDAFLDMSMSARCLYFTLNMFADDDGFIGSPKGIMRHCGASQDDLLLLLQKRFILAFDSGVIVIKHWRINNFLRKDRHIDTTYKEELAQIMLDENGSYTELKNGGQPMVNQWSTQNSIDKNSIDKNSIDKNSVVDVVVPKTAAPQPTIEEYEQIKDVWNSIPHTVSINSIIPMTKREDELRIVISMFGMDAIYEAMQKIADSEYLQKHGSVVFDRYMNRNAIQGVLEGSYDKDLSKIGKVETDGYDFC